MLISGGRGRYPNVVYPHISGQTCYQICNSTVHKICDGELAINGQIGQIKEPSTYVGRYYNYGCSSPSLAIYDETKSDADHVMGGKIYFRYCCCRD